MSRNAFTKQEREYIFATLEKATDRVASLQELADKYLTQPKNLKLMLERVYPDFYNNCFKSTVSTEKQLTKKELVDRIMYEVGWSGSVEYIRATAAKSSFPVAFLKEIYKRLVDAHLFEENEYEYLLNENCIHTPSTLSYWFTFFSTVPNVEKVKALKKLREHQENVKDYIDTIPDYILFKEIEEPEDEDEVSPISELDFL